MRILNHKHKEKYLIINGENFHKVWLKTILFKQKQNLIIHKFTIILLNFGLT